MQFQLTRPVWSVTQLWKRKNDNNFISTHTPRVERDINRIRKANVYFKFQLTRPVWSVTGVLKMNQNKSLISTHTPRVERDITIYAEWARYTDFNSHAPCGA